MHTIVRPLMNHSTSNADQRIENEKSADPFLHDVDGTPVFDKDSVLQECQKLCDATTCNNITNFNIDMLPLQENPQKTIWKECKEHDMFVPDPCNEDSEASINLATLKTIAMT